MFVSYRRQKQRDHVVALARSARTWHRLDALAAAGGGAFAVAPGAGRGAAPSGAGRLGAFRAPPFALDAPRWALLAARPGVARAGPSLASRSARSRDRPPEKYSRQPKIFQCLLELERGEI